MLTKLLKNEFIATGHYFSIIYLATAIAVAFSVVSILIKSNFLAALSCLLLILVAFAFTIVTLLVIFLSFNKTLYSDQGYLSFTLPVKTRDLLFSKFFVAFIWFLLSYAVTIGITYWSVMVMAKITQESIQDSASGSQLEGLLELFKAFVELPNKGAVIAFLGVAVLLVFAICLLIITVLFFSITMGNTRLFQKHNVAWSMIFTVAVGYVSYKIINFLSELYTVYANLTNTGMKLVVGDKLEAFTMFGMDMYLNINISMTVVAILFIVGFCALTNYIMRNKINVK